MKTYKDNAVVVKSKVSRVRTWTTFNSRPAQTAECSKCRIACNAVSLTCQRIWWTVVHEHRSTCEANKTTMKTMNLSFEICRNLGHILTILGHYCVIITCTNAKQDLPISKKCGRRGGLSRSSVPCSSLSLGHCVVFLGKTLYSHSVSLHPGQVYKWVPAKWG